ncbi:hypothetical protein LEP1GSC120_3508 [Leptospira santarosai str. 200702252]|nr:hypothetical protein LEP1GSC130_2738 [Leptospira santarosai str. 200403458]EMO96908.1 hypothetical protein LEP1GSC120_3508 [Leptospira santarosai str. 200702252]
MKDLLDKLSSYNLFNYLLPGVLFAFIEKDTFDFLSIKDNVIFAVFFCYFLGLLASRVGSLMIEPILKKVNFIKYSKYEDYLNASRKDPKIEILLETSNMYRTFIGLFVLITIFRFYGYLARTYFISKECSFYICIFSLIILFILSYKKQNGFILSRIANSKD